MNQKTFQILTDPELVAMRRAWEQRLKELSNGPIYLQGMARAGKTDMYENAEQRVQEAIDDLAKEVELLRDREVFRPLSVRAALHGVHFVDKILGANVFELDGETGNWQTKYLTSPVWSQYSTVAQVPWPQAVCRGPGGADWGCRSGR